MANRKYSKAQLSCKLAVLLVLASDEGIENPPKDEKALRAMLADITVEPSVSGSQLGTINRHQLHWGRCACYRAFKRGNLRTKATVAAVLDPTSDVSQFTTKGKGATLTAEQRADVVHFLTDGAESAGYERLDIIPDE